MRWRVDEAVAIAVGRDCLAPARTPSRSTADPGGRTGIEHLRDRGMRHDGQRLALGLEARDDVRGVHPGLDDFQRDLALNRTGLFGEPDLAHPACADALKETIRPDRLERSRSCLGLSDAVGILGIALL